MHRSIRTAHDVEFGVPFLLTVLFRRLA